MDDDTPSTDAVRAGYFDGEYDSYDPNYAPEVVYRRFDSWLEAHDREVQAKALEDAAEDFDRDPYRDPHTTDRPSQYLRIRAGNVRAKAETP